MAVVQYEVKCGTTYATLTTVQTNVQTVALRFGRERPLDQYSANTANVGLRYPTGYVTPNALLVTGNWVEIGIRLGTAGVYKRLFVGRIADVLVEYGIPYTGGVGNADFVTLACEGNFAAFGRLQGGTYSLPEQTLDTQMVNCQTQTGLIANADLIFGGAQTFPATPISGTWGDWLNQVALTLNGRIIDRNNEVYLVNAFYKAPNASGNFSDTTNNATNHPYEQISFSSFADNYYTQITVDPLLIGPVTVQTGVAPYRTYFVNTLSLTTGQATDFANYLLSTYQTQTTRILSVTCNLNAQSGGLPDFGSADVGDVVTVLFRGTTFNCVVEGATYQGNPKQSTATYFLSAQDLNNYLLLNDAIYGRLNFNKLGY